MAAAAVAYVFVTALLACSAHARRLQQASQAGGVRGDAQAACCL